ncbi:hypothetical protein [Sorangium sp. So ce1097]|uniref:hypothetical protein n=1 Tax=Sorangium sp. So ce1097 TaxID=3133330 RepID=UPI003F6355C9
MLSEGPPAQVDKLANALVFKHPSIPLLGNAEEYPLLTRVIDGVLALKKDRRELLLPNLHEFDTIGIFSDYGGEAPDSKYSTYSFLFSAYDLREDTLQRLEATRAANNGFGEMCFKKLDDGNRQRALPDWLAAPDRFEVPLSGLLFNLVVDKAVHSVVFKNDHLDRAVIAACLRDEGFGEWKPDVAEKLIRIVHCVAYWCAVLARDGQKLLWMTDDDAIVAQPRINGFRKILAAALRKYATIRYADIAFATPFKNAKRKGSLNDLLSYPDLAAGSFDSYFTTMQKFGTPVVKSTTVEVLNWLCEQGLGLKRLNILLEPNAIGGADATFFSMVRAIEQPPNTVRIGIRL